MPKFPSIPDFSADVNSMFKAMRAMKQIVEHLSGQLGGAGLGSKQGAASVYTQPNMPAGIEDVRDGDVWINTETGKIAYWWNNKWNPST